MTQSKKIILLTTGLILTICLMAFFGVYALTTLKNSTFNVGVKYEPEYLVKVEMGINRANDGTVNQNIEETEYVEIFNSLNPVSNGMYIDSMSNETIHINSQTLTPIGANGDVYFRITSLENETSGNKDLKCVIDCGSSTVDSGKLVIDTPKILTIATGIDATNGPVTSSSLGMIKIKLKFSEFLLDLKYLVGNDATGLDFGEAGKIETDSIPKTTFYVSDIDGLLNLSALVGQVNTTTTEYGSNYGYGYDNSSGPAVPFEGATIQMLNDIDFENGNDKNNFSKTFISIGNYSNSFQGTFDGNNKTITGLYINQIIDNAGLFGDVSNAEIKDLTMQNCKVVSKGYFVGSFVGTANGVIISNCGAEETEVNGINYGYYIGGMVGRVERTATITNCYNTGSVSGTSGVGGIVGYLKGTATITNCYNTGSVSGGWYVGGIVGYVYDFYDAGATTTITNCYNTGSVSGNSGSSSASGIGGIVGYLQGTATITNCYNTGSVSGSNNYIGGIVGYVYETVATITNCYYLKIKTSSVNANLNGVGHNGGTLDISSYYGTFEENQEVAIEYGSLPPELVSYSNLKDLLDAWVNRNKDTNPNLKNWQEDKENINNGYPLFVKE